MRFRPTSGWKNNAIWLLGFSALAIVIGFSLNVALESLLAVWGVALIVQLAHLHRLTYRLAGRQRWPLTDNDGLWGEINQVLYRRQRAEIVHKRRLVKFLCAFRDAASALPDAVVILNAEHRIVWFNTAACHLLALKYPQDIGGYLTNLVRAPRVVEWLESKGEGSLLDVSAPTDENIRLSLKLIPYANQQALLIARDVSQLLHLEQVRRDFVANVSHELRTPLTVVHGYLDMLEPEQMPGIENVLRELRAQSRRMMQIVEDLLALSRLDAQAAISEEQVVMRLMLEMLRREAAALSQGRHVIYVECASTQNLRGSNKDLHSAFSNLVGNAVRYTPAGGSISLRWESGVDGGRMSVSDTGQGISVQHIPRLTERFYRVSTSRSRETGGTGLGLSIVKHVLQSHQARLDIQSEVGVGSTFACIFGTERMIESSVAEELV